LVITYPEIAEMQTEAVISAACELAKEGKTIVPEIMIPLVGFKQELDFNLDIVHRVAKTTMEKYNTTIEYKVGTMIEVPRGAVTADDAGKFIKEYVNQNIFEKDPFQTLDQEGVGELVKMAVEKGRKTRPDIKLGICGEHGGDPESVKFCHKI
jgi:pyruvate, orthophosphate dikinase